MPATRIQSKAHSRHYAIRIGLVMVITADTLRRMIYGTRPIDYVMLVVEILVLLLIFGEIAVHANRYFRHRRRSGEVLKRLIKGQKLQSESPGTSGSGSLVTPWITATKEWANQTNDLLLKYSRAASAAFLHDVGGADVSFGFGHVNAFAQHAYVQLQTRLNNLRDILENPDVYL